MKRAHNVQVRNIAVELTTLVAAIKAIRNEAGSSMSTHEDIATARAIADIVNAVKHLQGAF